MRALKNYRFLKEHNNFLGNQKKDNLQIATFYVLGRHKIRFYKPLSLA